MKIKSFKIMIAIFTVVLMILPSGCTSSLPANDEDKPLVVVTLSFFEDMVDRVGGDKIRLKALVPVGVEPEEYDPVPADLRAIEDAAVLIYNGHNMERWLPRLVPDIHERPNSFRLAEHPGIEVILLPSGPFAGMPDPHAWTDIRYTIIYVEQIAEILSGVDPENEPYFRERAHAYMAELAELDRWIRAEVEQIPRERRLLVTSELCFQYFSAAYGFKHDAIWAINAAEEGSPAQIIRIMEFVQERGARALFVENQVDHRPMQQVSRETGVPIGGVLFSDSLSEPGGGAETYIEMMRANTRMIVDALTGKES